jgi:MlaC protein
MKAGKGTSFQQRYDVLAPLVTRAVDLDGILQDGVGPTWESLPPAQQAALKTAFQHYSIATYVSHFDAFTGERFDDIRRRPAIQWSESRSCRGSRATIRTSSATRCARPRLAGRRSMSRQTARLVRW